MATMQEGNKGSFFPNAERPDAFGCADFVSGKGEVIKGNGANVDEEFACCLHGVAVEGHPATPAE